MPKTAFVTGANGFIGLNLVEELLAQDWRVIAMHRAGSDIRQLQRLPAQRVVGDVTDYKSVREVLPEDVTAVFHVAGNTSLWARASGEQMRVNVRGTRNVVRAALEARARCFVHTSSIVAYGLHSGTITEETPTRGTNAKINYVRSKALAEREVRRGIVKGLPAVFVNPANVLGPYDAFNWARLFRLVQHHRLPGMPPGGGSFCHVKSVVRTHIAAAEQGRIGANYLLGGADTSYTALVHRIAEMLGRRFRSITMPPRLLRGYARLEEWIAPLFGREPDVTVDAVQLLSANLYCSSRRAIRELGYEPQPLDRMLDDCYRWLVAAKFLPARR